MSEAKKTEITGKGRNKMKDLRGADQETLTANASPELAGYRQMNCRQNLRNEIPEPALV